ncbi:hypothetical protein Patl1_09888 [Pistacia atlantica]|uniref:Uncharacterized protein n=1 Tax=Pistacia atlantica TaxID=434234 RepID=A0ACC1AA83_9ROSI|nr:hypothetical protein Patl1_09888 [Pistacia atlantica]
MYLNWRMTKDESCGPYQAALEKDWVYMMNFFEKNRNAMLIPLSTVGDTTFHLSVFSSQLNI